MDYHTTYIFLYLSAVLCTVLVVQGQITVTTSSNSPVIHGNQATLTCNFGAGTNLTKLTWTFTASSGGGATVLFQGNETSSQPYSVFASTRVTVDAISGGVSTVTLNDTVVGDSGTYACDVIDTDGDNGSDNTILVIQYGDDCSHGPCINGGTCTDDVGNYTCACLGCYGGRNCEIRTIDPCSTNPCSNGGTCVDECTTYSCTCAWGTSGSTCGTTCFSITSIGSNANDTKMLVGSSVTLDCNIGTTYDSVIWRKDLDTTSSGLSSSTILQLTNLTTADSGTYYCYVDKASCIDREGYTIDVYFELNPNTTTSENRTHKSGEDVSLSCSATGVPTPYLKWIFLSAGMTDEDEGSNSPGNDDSANVTTTTTTTAAPTAATPKQVGGAAEANSKSLTLNDVRRSQTGTYTCVAVIGGAMEVDIKVIHLTVEGPGGIKWWMIVIIVVIVIILIVLLIILIVYLVKKGKCNFCPCCKGAGTSSVGPSMDDTAKLTKPSPPHTNKTNGKPQYKVEGSHHEMNRYDDQGYDSEAPPPPPANVIMVGANKDKMVDPSTPRQLPPAPEGGKPNALAPLDVEQERKKMKKKKKKVRDDALARNDEFEYDGPENGNEDATEGY